MLCHLICFLIHMFSDFLGYLSHKQAIQIKKQKEEDPLTGYTRHDNSAPGANNTTSLIDVDEIGQDGETSRPLNS